MIYQNKTYSTGGALQIIESVLGTKEKYKIGLVMMSMTKLLKMNMCENNLEVTNLAIDDNTGETYNFVRLRGRMNSTFRYLWKAKECCGVPDCPNQKTHGYFCQTHADEYYSPNNTISAVEWWVDKLNLRDTPNQTIKSITRKGCEP